MARGKNLAAKFSRTLGILGAVAGIYSGTQTYGDYRNRKFTGFGATYIMTSSGVGVFGGGIGGSLDLGTTLGQWIVESDWYFNSVHNNNYW